MGWWAPGDARRTARPRSTPTRYPAPDGFGKAALALAPAAARWEEGRRGCSCWTGTTSSRPRTRVATALEFARSAFRHSCAVCAWDPALAASAEGKPPPVA